jgi:site-specific recombinase XerD
MRILTKESIKDYEANLVNEEKSQITIEKYMRDVRAFADWLGYGEFEKSDVLSYKSELQKRYAPTSVNTVISSLNSFFVYHEWYDMKVRTLKIQRQMFAEEERELTKAEYERLLSVAEKKNERLYLLMQTICSTGIRISELNFVTVEAIQKGKADIQAKGKRRTVFFPKQLCKMLMEYAKEKDIKKGAIFVTKGGLPMNRSNIWTSMKSLCREANVSEEKVFPHNLRHLFARTYYSQQKDIVRLADILGHSSVNTTRIYTMESGAIHRKQIQKLGLLRE